MTYSWVYGQIVVDKTSHDFGDLYAHSERFIDFHFKNTGTAKAYILRVEKQPNTVYQISSSTILPDSSVVLRIQVSEKKKGSFSIKIPVYLSDRNDAIELRVSGNIKELTPDLNSLTDCPNFNRRPSDGNPLDFLLTVVTVDKETRKLLDKSRVEVLQNGLVVGDWKTDKEGKIQKKVPLGFTYFYASHDGYKPGELGAYVNFKRNYILIELEKEPEPEIVVNIQNPTSLNQPAQTEKVEIPKPDPKHEPHEIVIEIDNSKPEKPRNNPKPKPTQPEVVNKPIETVENPIIKENPLENPAEPTPYFVPSNVVFVLDVSWSMNQEDRLELMKLALISLLEQVEPHDQVTVVSYGNNAQVLIPTTKGSQKQEIIERVSKINAGGMTAGGKGIKLGYNMAIRGEIDKGNNQIFVITDGAFNKDSQDYERTVKRNAEKGYVLSVVGIKTSSDDEEKMKEVATMGNGRFVSINSISDARTKLYEEMRRSSYRVK